MDGEETSSGRNAPGAEQPAAPAPPSPALPAVRSLPPAAAEGVSLPEAPAAGRFRGASELALAARAVHRQLRFPPGPLAVVLAGGAFRACPTLVTRVPDFLELPGAVAHLLECEPAAGAITLARDLLK